MRSRFVIPAAILVTAVYVKGRLDANLLREEAEHSVPVASPPVDPILRAQAEAEDAMVIAESQAAAAALEIESPPPRDLSYLSEWLTTPAGRVVPPGSRARDAFDPGPLVEWMTDPAPRPPRRTQAQEGLDPAALAEWVAHVSPVAAPASDQAGAEPSAEAEVVSAPEDAIEVRIDETGCFSLGGWAAQAGHMVLCGVTFRDRRDAPVDPASIRLVTDAVTNGGQGGLIVLGDAGFAPDREGFTILLAAEGPGSFAAAGRYEVVAG